MVHRLISQYIIVNIPIDIFIGDIEKVWGRDTEGYWGDWKGQRICPHHRYVYGLSQKSERENHDNSALNGVAFYCRGGSWVSSGQQKWGDWGTKSYCAGPHNYAVGFAVKIEAEQGRGDDSAANEVQVMKIHMFPHLF